MGCIIYYNYITQSIIMFDTLFYEHCDSFNDESQLVPSFNIDFKIEYGEVIDVDDVVFTDVEFELIQNNRYNTYEIKPFETEKEWEDVMKEASTMNEIENSNDDGLDSENDGDDDYYEYD